MSEQVASMLEPEPEPDAIITVKVWEDREAKVNIAGKGAMPASGLHMRLARKFMRRAYRTYRRDMAREEPPVREELPEPDGTVLAEEAETSKMSWSDLRAEASRLGVLKLSMNKAEVIAAIEDAHKGIEAAQSEKEN